MSEIGTRLDALRAMFGDEGFLQNKGLSQTRLGLYIFRLSAASEEYGGSRVLCARSARNMRANRINAV